MVSSLQDLNQSTIVSYLIFMPLLPDLTILTFGEAQAHTHNFYLGEWGGAGPEAIHKICVGKKCSCAVCVVSPRKFSTNNLSVFYIVTYIVNHIFES